jgi:hypothetical protein
MNSTTKMKLTIRYVDGGQDVFEFEEPPETHSLTSRFAQTREAASIVLDLGDRVLAVPYASIKAIEISPTPPHLPKHAIRNVTRVS